MATKHLETLSGAVESVNSKNTGIKVLGEWLNVSQYHPLAVMPTPGELVEVQVERGDKGAWINSLRILDGDLDELPYELRTAAAPARPVPGRSDDHAVRIAALQAAATFAAGKIAGSGGDISTADMLRVADALEAWIRKGGAADRSKLATID